MFWDLKFFFAWIIKENLGLNTFSHPATLKNHVFPLPWKADICSSRKIFCPYLCPISILILLTQFSLDLSYLFLSLSHLSHFPHWPFLPKYISVHKLHQPSFRQLCPRDHVWHTIFGHAPTFSVSTVLRGRVSLPRLTTFIVALSHCNIAPLRSYTASVLYWPTAILHRCPAVSLQNT